MSEKPAIVVSIDALRSFVRALKKRPDIQVDVATLGRKAPKAALKNAEDRLGGVLGGELLAFYAAMNGAELRWSFIEGPGGGRLVIPPLANALFESDEQHHMGFGTDMEALFLDGTGDTGAWVVRKAGSSEAGEIIFAAAAEGQAGIRLGGSLASYLSAAMDAGCVVNWPGCSGAEEGLYTASEDSLRKFKAAPVKPRAIRPGTRVQFRSFNSKPGRGEALEVFQIEDDLLPSYQAHVGVRFVKVRVDVGFTVWMPEKYMSAQKKEDAYETLRGNIEGDELEALLENIACAIGPSGSTNGGIGRDNACRGAGLLAPYAIGEAFERVFDLYDAAVASKLDLVTLVNIEARKKDVFLAAAFKPRWSYQREAPLIGLIGGLRLLMTQAALNVKTTRAALLTPGMIARLHAYESAGAAGAYTEIRILRNGLEDEPHPIPWGTHNQSIASTIGLAEGEQLFMGS